MRRNALSDKITRLKNILVIPHLKLVKSDDIYQVEGTISEALPNTMFRVKVDEEAPQDLGGNTILCTLSGKMRMYRIKVMPGDKVKCDISRYDTTRGRITFRQK